MIVTVNYEKQLREAYDAGAAAMALHLRNKQPKPDADKYIERCREDKTVAKF